jgi:DNA modification methylase
MAYRDTWPGGLDGYLDMLRARLLAIRPLLAATGNLFVHLDWHAVHYVKVLCDELLGAANFRNEIVWRRANAHNDPARFGVITDAILFYGASARAHWADVHVPHEPRYIASHWRRSDARGRYRLVPLDAPRHGEGGNLVYPWRGKLPAPSRTWAVGRAAMEALERDGLIAYTASGTPTRKRYLADSPGLRAQNLWDDIPPVNPMAAERLGYPTQKPVALLERIIAAACPADGLVLDAFAGSGTTLEAAERLGRRWIGIDSNPAAVQLARRRILALAGQPGRTEGKVAYRECQHCRQISLHTRSARGAAIVARPFTVERVGAPAQVEKLALAGEAGALHVTVELEGERVRVRLHGPLESVAAWSVDWAHTDVMVSTTHLLRPRRGTIAAVGEHVYAEAGPRTIAVQVVDDAGSVARALVPVVV